MATRLYPPLSFFPPRGRFSSPPPPPPFPFSRAFKEEERKKSKDFVTAAFPSFLSSLSLFGSPSFFVLFLAPILENTFPPIFSFPSEICEVSSPSLSFSPPPPNSFSPFFRADESEWMRPNIRFLFPSLFFSSSFPFLSFFFFPFDFGFENAERDAPERLAFPLSRTFFLSPPPPPPFFFSSSVDGLLRGI